MWLGEGGLAKNMVLKAKSSCKACTFDEVGDFGYGGSVGGAGQASSHHRGFS